jgi:hypothetical protein
MSDIHTTLYDIANHCKVSERTISRLIDAYNKKSDKCLTNIEIDGQDKRKKFYLIADVNRVLAFGGYPPIVKAVAAPVANESYVSAGPLTLHPPVQMVPDTLDTAGIKLTQKQAMRANEDNVFSVQALFSQVFKARVVHNLEQGLASIDVATANAMGDALR